MDGVGFLGGLLLVVSGFKGMCFQPGFAVVGSKGLCLIVLQVNEVIIVNDTAFGDMCAKLTAKHLVQFTGSEVRIVIQHSIDELIHAV